jgi:hypothetical protein
MANHAIRGWLQDDVNAAISRTIEGCAQDAVNRGQCRTDERSNMQMVLLPSKLSRDSSCATIRFFLLQPMKMMVQGN